MNELKAQAIELYAKQLRTPMFNKYQDIIRQLDKQQGYEDFLIAVCSAFDEAAPKEQGSAFVQREML